MKFQVGDLVKWQETVGIVTRVYKHKLWRTDERGKNVDWNSIKPEPFADVQIGNQLRRLPQSDLELIK